MASSCYSVIKPRPARIGICVPIHMSRVQSLIRHAPTVIWSGTVTEFELFDIPAWVNQLSHNYTGADYAHGADGELRYKITIRIDSWTAQS